MFRLWPILMVGVCTLAFAKASVPDAWHPATQAERGLVAWKPLTRASQFSDVPHVTNFPSDCGEVKPPQALTTPAPLMSHAITSTKARVSFIVGVDGRVHSPLILESAGASGDRSILRAVRTWKYRPATCNGVPTEAEAKIEFSSR